MRSEGELDRRLSMDALSCTWSMLFRNMGYSNRVGNI